MGDQPWVSSERPRERWAVELPGDELLQCLEQREQTSFDVIEVILAQLPQEDQVITGVEEQMEAKRKLAES